MGPEVMPFRIEVAEAELTDLRRRLRQTRWPEAELVADWSQGVPLVYLRELCEYWADGYDWRATEARLNAWPLFQTAIDRVRIVFGHVRSPRADALPLVLTHGWPGSVVEFLKVIGPLSDPVRFGGTRRTPTMWCGPSLPGYGFSGKPDETGWGVERIAAAWAELMARLGYSRYGAAGSDWGTSVSAILGQNCSGRPGDGRRSASPTSVTGASRRAAVTSPRSSSRNCSSGKYGRSSGSFGNFWLVRRTREGSQAGSSMAC